MADTASDCYGYRPTKKVPLSVEMSPTQIAEGQYFVENVWWPQVCHSARSKEMVNTGTFQEGWFDANGLLDCHNPAYWKIINGLGVIYCRIDNEYPNDPMKKWQVRFDVAPNGLAQLRVVYRRKNKSEVFKGFRITGPQSGWLDFQMEADVLRAQRDARNAQANKTTDTTNAVVAPKMAIGGDGALVHSAHFTPDGLPPTFSRAQRKDLIEKMADAARSPIPKKRPSSVSSLKSNEGGLTVARVTKWIVKQGDQENYDPLTYHPSIQQADTSSIDRPTDQQALDKQMGFVRDDRDPPFDEPSVAGATTDDSTISVSFRKLSLSLPDIEDSVEDGPSFDNLSSRTVSRAASPELDLTTIPVSELEDDGEDWTVVDELFLRSLQKARPEQDKDEGKKADAKTAPQGWFSSVRSWMPT